MKQRTPFRSAPAPARPPRRPLARPARESILPLSRAAAPASERAICPLSPRSCPFGGACHTCPLGFQAKLTVDAPDSPLEREADRTADRVLRMPAPAADEGRDDETVQRAPAADEGRDDEAVQRAAAGAVPQVTPELAARIAAVRGGGEALPRAERAFFEPRFGRDLGGVRVHTGAEAGRLARSVQARAFTVGRDIVFGAGQYAPGSGEGRRLLAHELTHVAQQGQAAPVRRVQREAQPLVAEALSPEADLGRILGPEPQEQSIAYRPEQMDAVHLYLKRLRRDRADLVPEAKLVLERYFPGYGDQIWADSARPLAGYTGTSYQYQAGRRLVKAQQLGLRKSGEKTLKRRFLGSDVVFFSGHHFAGYGSPGKFEGLDLRDLVFVAPRVKLIMISSCNGLAPNARKLWKKRFPNAYILGWRWGGPLAQKDMMSRFLDKLPADLDLEDARSLANLIALWRQYTEALSQKGGLIAPLGLGYSTPDGTVAYYVRSKKGGWQWTTE